MNKTGYKLAFEVVGTVIRAWDPYSLLALGAPKDEFDSEIASVVGQIQRIRSAEDAALVISRTFSSAFEPPLFTSEYCQEVGRDLFAALVEHGFIGRAP